MRQVHDRLSAGSAHRLPEHERLCPGGDYEGVLSYGIGYTRAAPLSNPQTYVRAYEVETVTAAGQHRYVVAIDINAARHH